VQVKDISNKVSIPKPLLENVKELQIKKEVCEDNNASNPFKVKLEFSQTIFTHTSEHLKTYEEMYNPLQYQQSIYAHDHLPVLHHDSDSRMTHYTEENTNFYTTDPSMFLIKQEDDINKDLHSSPFLHKNYTLLQSPISKKKVNEQPRHRYRENYYNNEQNENINISNISKGDTSTDNLFFESPFLQKKVKFNTGISPNRVDTDRGFSKMSER